jgi:16S rRNA (cytosine1402-N4)-methyltransferase
MSNSLTPVRAQHSLSREEESDAREWDSANYQGAGAKHPHQSVMLKEVVELLAPKKGEVVVDATFGAGGHSRALKAAAKIKLIAIDADPAAGDGVFEANFADLDQVLKKEGVEKINKVLFDLGWNKGQLSAGKGFSFMTNEPLLMTYGKKPASGFTAAEIVNTWSEKVLADVFFGYGEERYARRIAKAIVARRKIQKIERTIELVEIIRDAVPPAYRHGRLNPATRSFQALRIAVNDELKCIERGLESAWKHLNCGGRIAVITFHSTEDRVVKKIFAQFVKKEDAKMHGVLIVKKPLTPTKAEIINNPSARSAKLRIIEKICKET